MRGSGERPIARRLVVSGVVAIVGAILGAVLLADSGLAARASARLAAATSPAPGSGVPRVAPAPASAACGVASTATIAGVDAIVARGIYAGELNGREVRST